MTIQGLEIDEHGERPVYRQIADGIREALRDGRLREGHRLPPTRDLARQLGVNRNTVVAAYDLLGEEGLIHSHTGRGTFLTTKTSPPSDPAVDGASTSDPWFNAFSRAVENPGVGALLTIYRAALSRDGISFAGSYPAGELMPVEEFRSALDTVLREQGVELLSYGPTAGYLPLREVIAAEMAARGSSGASADDVLITNGSQQALEITFRALIDTGDAVALEDPTYTGALSVLGSLGARLVGVPLDDEGIRPDLLAMALERHRPRVLYVQPTFQNPTTRVMGETRRREVLTLAARHRCVVVEDDWAGDLRFEGPDLPTLHALDGGRRVIHIGTFSKKLLPGLRIGWVAAPMPVSDRLVALKQIQDCGTSPFTQAALHAFLVQGGMARHLARVLPVYRDRRDAMLRALAEKAAPGVSWSSPPGGLFLWVTLPPSLDGKKLSLTARERGVWVSPGELFHVDGSGRNTLRLTYAAVPPDQIESGIAVLGELMRDGAREGPVRAGRSLEAVPIL